MKGPPPNLMAQLQARQQSAGNEGDNETSSKPKAPAGLMAALSRPPPGAAAAAAKPKKKEVPKCPEGKLFHFEESLDAFLFDFSNDTPKLTTDKNGQADTDILVPLPPCIYRMVRPKYMFMFMIIILDWNCLVKNFILTIVLYVYASC